MEGQYKDLENRLQRARINLLQNHFFLGSFLVNLPTSIDPQVQTAETNGEWIKYNPNFIRPLTDGNILFLYAHEVMHVVLEHNFRFGNRDIETWQQACDVVVNFLLIKDGIGEFIQGGIHEPDLYTKGQGQVERIYDLLIQESPPISIVININGGSDGNEGNQDSSSGSSSKSVKGKSFDKLLPQLGSISELKDKLEALKDKVATALNAAKLCGNSPQCIERFVEESLYTEPSCLEVLQDYMVKLKSSRRTYSRPSRRFINRGVYLPSIPKDNQSGHIAVCCDASGSISKEDLAYFKGMLEMCRDIYNPQLMTISYFDYVVHSIESFTQDDEIRIPIKGNGGTSYHDLWDKYKEPPDVCLVFSDMDCKSFGKAPDYPVIWISTGKLPKVPFGKVINFFAR